MIHPVRSANKLFLQNKYQLQWTMPLQTRDILLLLDRKGYVKQMTCKRPIPNMQLGLIIIQAVTCVARRAINPITFMDRFIRLQPCHTHSAPPPLSFFSHQSLSSSSLPPSNVLKYYEGSRCRIGDELPPCVDISSARLVKEICSQTPTEGTGRIRDDIAEVVRNCLWGQEKLGLLSLRCGSS